MTLCTYCNREFPLDEENNKKEKYLQCPFCGRLMINPFYDDTNRD